MSASRIKKERMRQQERRSDEAGVRQRRGEIRGRAGGVCGAGGVLRGVFREKATEVVEPAAAVAAGAVCRDLVLRRCSVI